MTKQDDGSDEYKGVCGSDSGSPAFVVSGNDSSKPECLYGVVSWGILGQCDSDAILTRVSAYYEWIKKNTCTGWRFPEDLERCWTLNNTKTCVHF